MSATIKIATCDDIHLIADFLVMMQEELRELDLRYDTLIKRLADKFDQVTWFLFYDENGVPFGTMYASKQFAYWKDSFRYKIGGVYIKPEFRGRGYYRQVMNLMQEWAKSQGAYGFLADVYTGNEHSAKSLCSVGFTEMDYKNYTKEF